MTTKNTGFLEPIERDQRGRKPLDEELDGAHTSRAGGEDEADPSLVTAILREAKKKKPISTGPLGEILRRQGLSKSDSN